MASGNPMRTCTKCGETFPATTEFFTVNRKGTHGLRSHCKPCQRRDKVAYNAAHREERRLYYLTHREAILADRSQYYSANRQAICDRVCRWARDNPVLVQAAHRNRAARRDGNGGKHTAGDVRDQRQRQKDRCYWCGEKTGKHYHVDHVIPLALGGTNGPENIVIACPTCNLRKGAKHPIDFCGRLL